MSFESKRRLAWSMVILIGVWPPVHHVLVPRLDLNPWKWFGWSMYTVPPPIVNVYPMSGATGRMLAVERLDPSTRSELQRVYQEFGRLRVELGGHVRPDDFARALLAAFPDEQHIDIVVQRVGLDRTTAIYRETRRVTYSYPRDPGLATKRGQPPFSPPAEKGADRVSSPAEKGG